MKHCPMITGACYYYKEMGHIAAKYPKKILPPPNNQGHNEGLVRGPLEGLKAKCSLSLKNMLPWLKMQKPSGNKDKVTVMCFKSDVKILVNK